MLSIGRVASGQAAVAYFTGGQDARAAGCGVGYYTRDDAAAGRWVGSGAAALGLSGELDPSGVRVLAGLLDGVGPDGTRLVEPVLRADPAG
ncbi:MAG: relaxase domain-containing protein, partial [Candidatus Nanopelagicales bacterium]|nr:relaxase domain-containing protein [Candidatus Nanopelagicales bacterium]